MEISVLNANLWLLPPPAAVDNNKRLFKFIKLIKKYSPDVVNLQEVWLNKYTNYLKYNLPEYNLTKPKSFFINKSGLVTLSRFKPIKFSFSQYPKHKDFDAVEKVASKGYLKITFKKEGKEITLINTHIYETLEQVKLKIKFGQIKHLLKKTLEHNPTIVAGDFNADTFNLPNGFNNLAAENDYKPTYSLENKYAKALINGIMNRHGVHYQKPDYVFANIKGAKIESQVIKNPLISDHYPIYAKVTFKV